MHIQKYFSLTPKEDINLKNLVSELSKSKKSIRQIRKFGTIVDNEDISETDQTNVNPEFLEPTQDGNHWENEVKEINEETNNSDDNNHITRSKSVMTNEKNTPNEKNKYEQKKIRNEIHNNLEHELHKWKTFSVSDRLISSNFKENDLFQRIFKNISEEQKRKKSQKMKEKNAGKMTIDLVSNSEERTAKLKESFCELKKIIDDKKKYITTLKEQHKLGLSEQFSDLLSTSYETNREGDTSKQVDPYRNIIEDRSFREINDSPEKINESIDQSKSANSVNIQKDNSDMEISKEEIEKTKNYTTEIDIPLHTNKENNVDYKYQNNRESKEEINDTSLHDTFCNHTSFFPFKKKIKLKLGTNAQNKYRKRKNKKKKDIHLYKENYHKTEDAKEAPLYSCKEDDEDTCKILNRIKEKKKDSNNDTFEKYLETRKETHNPSYSKDIHKINVNHKTRSVPKKFLRNKTGSNRENRRKCKSRIPKETYKKKDYKDVAKDSAENKQSTDGTEPIDPKRINMNNEDINKEQIITEVLSFYKQYKEKVHNLIVEEYNYLIKLQKNILRKYDNNEDTVVDCIKSEANLQGWDQLESTKKLFDEFLLSFNFDLTKRIAQEYNDFKKENTIKKDTHHSVQANYRNPKEHECKIIRTQTEQKIKDLEYLLRTVKKDSLQKEQRNYTENIMEKKKETNETFSNYSVQNEFAETNSQKREMTKRILKKVRANSYFKYRNVSFGSNIHKDKQIKKSKKKEEGKYSNKTKEEYPKDHTNWMTLLSKLKETTFKKTKKSNSQYTSPSNYKQKEENNETSDGCEKQKVENYNLNKITYTEEKNIHNISKDQSTYVKKSSLNENNDCSKKSNRPLKLIPKESYRNNSSTDSIIYRQEDQPKSSTSKSSKKDHTSSDESKQSNLEISKRHLWKVPSLSSNKILERNNQALTEEESQEEKENKTIQIDSKKKEKGKHSSEQLDNKNKANLRSNEKRNGTISCENLSPRNDEQIKKKKNGKNHFSETTKNPMKYMKLKTSKIEKEKANICDKTYLTLEHTRTHHLDFSNSRNLEPMENNRERQFLGRNNKSNSLRISDLDNAESLNNNSFLFKNLIKNNTFINKEFDYSMKEEGIKHINSLEEKESLMNCVNYSVKGENRSYEHIAFNSSKLDTESDISVNIKNNIFDSSNSMWINEKEKKKGISFDDSIYTDYQNYQKMKGIYNNERELFNHTKQWNEDEVNLHIMNDPTNGKLDKVFERIHELKRYIINNNFYIPCLLCDEYLFKLENCNDEMYAQLLNDINGRRKNLVCMICKHKRKLEEKYKSMNDLYGNERINKEEEEIIEEPMNNQHFENKINNYGKEKRESENEDCPYFENNYDNIRNTYFKNNESLQRFLSNQRNVTDDDPLALEELQTPKRSIREKQDALVNEEINKSKYQKQYNYLLNEIYSVGRRNKKSLKGIDKDKEEKEKEEIEVGSNYGKYINRNIHINLNVSSHSSTIGEPKESSFLLNESLRNYSYLLNKSHSNENYLFFNHFSNKLDKINRSFSMDNQALTGGSVDLSVFNPVKEKYNIRGRYTNGSNITNSESFGNFVSEGHERKYSIDNNKLEEVSFLKKLNENYKTYRNESIDNTLWREHRIQNEDNEKDLRLSEKNLFGKIVNATTKETKRNLRKNKSSEKNIELKKDFGESQKLSYTVIKNSFNKLRKSNS